MKKGIAIVFFVLVALAVYGFFAFSTSETSLNMDEYKERWDVTISQPDEFERIWASKSSAFGDGEWVTRLTYDQPIPFDKLSGWVEVTETTIDDTKVAVSQFLSRTKEMYQVMGETDFAEVMNVYPITVEIGDYYVHRTENNDFDTFTAVYNKEEQQIYILVWHQ